MGVTLSFSEKGKEKSEEGKIALTQYVRDGGDASYILYIWGLTYIIYKER